MERKQLYWFIITLVCIITLAVVAILKADMLSAIIGAIIALLGSIANQQRKTNGDGEEEEEDEDEEDIDEDEDEDEDEED